MKITVLGGGPAGLFFALLMKKEDRRHEVDVYERNPRDNTFGWGVVFSARTMQILAEPDPETFERIQKHLRTWENVDVIHQGVKESIAGNRFSGIARIALLKVLQDRCQKLGVRLHFEHPVSHPRPYRDSDLIVGADGVGSALRTRYSHAFRPTIQYGRNRYIWFGTPRPFGGLTLIFRFNKYGLFMAHAYKYSKDMSTFIVEVDQLTWDGFLGRPRAWVRSTVEDAFAEDLKAQPLLSNRSHWIRFRNVKNELWWYKNMVLIGDALHTAHFSIGSGTKLALEDSIALWRSFQQHPTVQAALPHFEATRRPEVEALQAVAERSQSWFECARTRIHLPPTPFAYDVMTRSSRVDAENLERRDPAFVRRYEESMEGRALSTLRLRT